MKNAAIIILVILLCALAFDDWKHRRYYPSVDTIEAIRHEVRASRDTTTSSDTGAAPKLPQISQRPESPSAISQKMLEITRQQIQKTIPLLFSRYFATAHLSKAKTDLLLELMVDRWMVGLEPDVQGAGADPLKDTKNDKMIEDLIGKEGLVQLEASRFSYLADQEAQDVVDAAFAGRTLNEAQLAAVTVAVKGYRPDQGLGDLMSAKTQITPAVEDTLRSDYRTREERTLGALAGVIEPSDVAKFRAWSDAEFEKQLAFLKMVQGQKSGNG